jgi:uncharacterized protein (TIGR00730 family)
MPEDPGPKPEGAVSPPPPRRRQPLPSSTPKAPEEDPEGRDRVARILASPSYLRTDQDIDILRRDELRPTRLQLDYLKPELIMQDHGVVSTIVVFGGTRIAEPAAALRRLERARARVAENPNDHSLQRAARVAERVVAKSSYYDVAREFGRLVGRSGSGPLDCRLVVVTGGGPGIMEAANRGADDVGAKSVGLNITLPEEQFPNPYITPELCFLFHYFALRKMHFLMRAKALVAFPGGYGTLDELFETLCLVQTRKVEPLPVVLVGEEYWRKVFDASYLADEGVIDEEDVSLFTFAESAEEIWATILEWYRRSDIPLVG